MLRIIELNTPDGLDGGTGLLAGLLGVGGGQTGSLQDGLASTKKLYRRMKIVRIICCGEARIF